MGDFVHLRHKPPAALDRPRELVVVCDAMRSNVNLSRIARTAGCCGVERLICCGTAKLQAKIARDAAERMRIEVHRSLPPVLRNLKEQGLTLVGLEQTTGSESLYSFQFERAVALIVGNERTGLGDDVLRLLDQVVEIPVYGMPYSHNAATAASMALYEYCRQFPTG
jgi:tRNA G18 (ribose-2'-O)-methylase SpoU